MAEVPGRALVRAEALRVDPAAGRGDREEQESDAERGDARGTNELLTSYV